MTEQRHRNHAHRPYPTVVAGLFTVTAFILIVGQIVFGWETRDWAIVSLVGASFTLGLISRFYTVGLQDRIIMLEMKVRCAEMLPAGQDANLAKLSKKQIVALRFASDDELGTLLERAARENLDPKAIKASIRTWRPDPHRT